MVSKEQMQLTMQLLTSLINSNLVTDKASALEIIKLMEEMVKKGF